MIERIDDEEERLVMVDLKPLMDRPLDLHGASLHVRRRYSVLEFAERAQEPASIGASSILGAHESKFDREPEEARHSLDDAGERPRAFLRVADHRHHIRRGMRAFTE